MAGFRGLRSNRRGECCGVFRATRRADGWWDGGLLTTDGSEDEFIV
ncbi:hypothetical protein [Streptomyces pseudogriseolus]